VSPVLANFLFEAANFLLLAVVLGWVLFKPVRRALDRERERHDKEVGESQRLRAEAESLAKEARAAKEAATREADERRRESLETARREAAEIIEIARKAQLAERRRFEQELAVRREAEAANLAEAVGRIAAASVRSFLGALEGPALDAALVRAAREELDAVPKAARRPAVVECARPLDAETRAILESVLGEGFQERIVRELGAGVRVTTPAGQVDATAVALARRAALAVKSDGGPAAGGVEASDA
jgi:F0F1-type ATP synthase membrane subunit b/b'